MASPDREPSSSSSPPPPSAPIVPAESDSISASSSSSSSAAPAAAVAAAAGTSAGKKPAWNRPSNGANEAGPVVDADSWPALSESTKASLKPSFSSDLPKISDGSASNPGPSVSTSSPRRNSSNANPNPTPNSSTLFRQRSMRRGAPVNGSNRLLRGVKSLSRQPEEIPTPPRSKRPSNSSRSAPTATATATATAQPAATASGPELFEISEDEDSITSICRKQQRLSYEQESISVQQERIFLNLQRIKAAQEDMEKDCKTMTKWVKKILTKFGCSYSDESGSE